MLPIWNIEGAGASGNANVFYRSRNYQRGGA
jgi:hypothetical protein